MDESFKAMKNKLQHLPSKIQNKIVTQATRRAAKEVQMEAKRLVPVDTGALKMSIKVIKVKRIDTPTGHVKYLIMPVTHLKKTRRVSVNGQKATLRYKLYTYYGHMVEYGTSKMPAQPFMRPAAENTLQKAFNAFFSHVRNRLDKEIK